MRSIFSTFALVAIFGFALTFTFSCSGGDDSEGGGTSSPSSGGSTNKCTDIANCKKKQIGSQVWLAENLNIDVSGSVCYDKKESNCDKYGRLYTWAAAMDIDSKYNEQLWGESDVRHQGICPTGWHIPSNDDWNELIDYVESENGCSNCADKYLKSKSGWERGGNGNDKYEFSALSGGGGSSGGRFYDVGNFGFWWSASENYSIIANNNWDAYYGVWDGSSKHDLFSVRCVQDSPSGGSSSSSSLTQSSSSSKTSPSGGYSSGSTDLDVIVIDNFAVALYDIRVVIEGTVLATMADPIVKVTYSISPPGKLSWILYDRSPLTGPIIVNEKSSFDLVDARIDLRNEEIQCGVTYSVTVEAWTKSGKRATRVGTFEKPDSLCL